jgi:hypothetical protein
LVVAVGDDLALLAEYHDPVGTFGHVQAMRDQQRGPVRKHRVEGTLRHALRRNVQRRRCLVHDQHGRVGQERPGERDEPALTGRQHYATIGDLGAVPVGECGDELVRVDCRGSTVSVTCRSSHLSPCASGTRKPTSRSSRRPPRARCGAGPSLISQGASKISAIRLAAVIAS